MPRRPIYFLVTILLLVGVALGSGCKSNPVGRQCFIDTGEGDGGVPVTVVASPALECQSLTCLHVAGHSPDLCTGTCNSAEDCDTSPESPCKGGFACTTQTVVGNFCCQKFCVCKDYLAEEPTTVDEAACVSSNPANECCNLDGRRDNTAMYPGCK